MGSISTLKDVRQINKNKILQQVYFNAPLSRLEICNNTGLSPATVGNLVGPLLEMGIVRETGFEESKGGRRRVILETNNTFGYFLGIDLGRTYIQLEMFDLHMAKIISRKHLLKDTEYSSDVIIGIIKKEINSILEELNLEIDRVLGIGIALPGLVYLSREELLHDPANEFNNLKSKISEIYNIPVLIDNSSKSMALAEFWFGAGRSSKNIVSTVIGRGVGAGIIVDDKLIRGSSNYAGEWGHTIISYCKGEGKKSFKTIEMLINESLNNFWIKKENQENINHIDPIIEVNAFKSFAEAGDNDALIVIDEISEILGIGIVNLINIFNPDLIILGGWLGISLSRLLIPGILEIVESIALSPSVKSVKIEASHFGNGEICIGAACLVINSYLGFDF